MTEYRNEVNPPMDDALAHYGVKGMKWGVRKKSGSRLNETTDIKTARKNVSAGEKAIRTQKRVVRKTKDASQKEVEKKKLDDLKSSHLKNPDRLTALRLTKGEQAVAAMLAVSGQGKFVTSSLLAREVEAQLTKRELKKK